MTDHAVIQGTYSKWEHLPTRKIVRISIDIPEEADKHASEVLGGMPKHGEPIWMVLARMNPEAIQRAPSAPEEASETEKWRRRFNVASYDELEDRLGRMAVVDSEKVFAEIRALADADAAALRGPSGPSAPKATGMTPSAAVRRGEAEAQAREHRKWGDLPASQRAALMCKDEEFREWFTEFGGAYENEAEFDEGFKRHFGITSKRQLDNEGPETQSFERLERDWLAFKHGEPPVEAYETEEVR